ncbi:MAG: hypothetical protein U0Z17_04700 [Bacteroidales bacterium]
MNSGISWKNFNVLHWFTHIEFTLTNNDKPVFHLTKGNLRQRIVHFLATRLTKALPVEAKTELVSVTGYIRKPESARKTRVSNTFCKRTVYPSSLTCIMPLNRLSKS